MGYIYIIKQTLHHPSRSHSDKTQDVDLVFVGTHGKGGLFHTSATEKLINHLFKPIISYQLNN